VTRLLLNDILRRGSRSQNRRFEGRQSSDRSLARPAQWAAGHGEWALNSLSITKAQSPTWRAQSPGIRSAAQKRPWTSSN